MVVLYAVRCDPVLQRDAGRWGGDEEGRAGDSSAAGVVSRPALVQSEGCGQRGRRERERGGRRVQYRHHWTPHHSAQFGTVLREKKRKNIGFNFKIHPHIQLTEIESDSALILHSHFVATSGLAGFTPCLCHWISFVTDD